MKTIAIIFSMLAFLAFNSYSQDKDVKQLLDNEETRTAIFNAIADNQELMNGFMEVAKGNNPMMEKSGKMEMPHDQLDSQHKHQMMGHGNMMGMMKENSEMMQKMMGNMMDMCKLDSAMCNKMADMMAESPEMMEICIKMMSNNKEMNTNNSGSDTNRPRYRRR